MSRLLAAGFGCCLLAGCSGDHLARAAKPDEGLLPPVVGPITKMNRSLRELPPPEHRVAVAVYGYTDQTGQFKPVENVQSLSRAVTQGATSVLIKALQDTSDGRWFIVVEREKLDNLLKERRIITDMRERYLGEKQLNPQALPPLLFAGVLLEGGIIGYDSNTRTGGAGARYLGIGGDVQYREDTVTVYLRAVSTKTGEVMVSVVSHKTIISVGIRGSAFKYVALDRILEVEAGFTRNEPEQLAIQGAIEKAVYAMIMEGAARGIWAFADKIYQAKAVRDFDREQVLARAKTNPADGGQKTEVASQGAPSAQSVASSNAPAPAAAGSGPPAQAVAPSAAPQAVQPAAGPPPAPPPVAAKSVPPQAAHAPPARQVSEAASIGRAAPADAGQGNGVSQSPAGLIAAGGIGPAIAGGSVAPAGSTRSNDTPGLWTATLSRLGTPALPGPGRERIAIPARTAEEDIAGGGMAGR